MALIFYTGGPAAAVASIAAAAAGLTEQSVTGITYPATYGPLTTYLITRLITQRYSPGMYAIRTQGGSASTSSGHTKS